MVQGSGADFHGENTSTLASVELRALQGLAEQVTAGTSQLQHTTEHTTQHTPPYAPTKAWIIPGPYFQGNVSEETEKEISNFKTVWWLLGYRHKWRWSIGEVIPLPGLELGPQRPYRERCLYAWKHVHQTHKCSGGRACRGNTMHKAPPECNRRE